MSEMILASGRDPVSLWTMTGERGAETAMYALAAIEHPKAVAGIVPVFVALSPDYDPRLGAANHAQNAAAAKIVRAQLVCPKLPPP